MMQAFIKSALVAAIAVTSVFAQAAGKHDYTYTPVAGVHEVQYFHGCFDHADAEKRPKVDVLMSGLSTGDVFIETRQRQEGKPSSEMVTYRLKNMDASLSVQFRSNDGAHCQQGVQSVIFKNATLRREVDLNAFR